MAIIVPIGVDTSGLTRGLSRGTSGLRKFGKMAASVGVAVGGVLAVGLVRSIKSASDLNEEISKSGVVFGKSAKKIGDWAKTTADSLGMSERMSLQAASTFALFAKSAGLGSGETAKFSTGLVKLAADLASFNNATPEETILAIGAALRGENEPIRRFGVLIDDARLRNEALKQGLIETTKEALTPQQKVLAAHALILKDTTVAQGDFARTSSGLANQQRIVKAQIENLSATLGATFLPIVARAMGAVTSFVKGFTNRPTLTAKIDFVVGKFQDLFWSGVSTISDWWQKRKVTFEDNPANRLKVTITPSGEEQVNTFFENIKKSLDKKVDTLGKALGRQIVRAIFFGGKDQATTSGDEFIDELVVSLFIDRPFLVLGKRFVLAIFDGMREEFNKTAADNPVMTFVNALGNVISPVLTEAIRIIASNKKAFKTGFDIILVDPIKEAIASARASLSGLGSEIGGFLERIGAAGGKSKEAAAIRKRLKDEADAREKARLTEAVAMAETDEERATATRELNDFIDNQTADRLDAEVKATQDANQQKIDDLIQTFLNGTIAAEQFATDLNAIIGQDFGGSLGIAFVAGFKGAIANLVTEIQSIQTGAAGTQAPAGTGVAAAQSQVQADKLANYKEAVSKHRADRAERLKRAEDGRRAAGSRAGSRIDPGERAEIHEIMRLWDENNKPPTRAAFGLAAGGILKRQVFTAGEAGREAVIPLGSNEAMRIMRDALGGGGGATYNIVVNAGLGTNPDELGRTIVESIKKFEKRNGQVFAGPQIQATSAGVSTSGGTQTRSLRIG